MSIIFFHRNIKCGYSINKVTQTVIKDLFPKKEFFVPSTRANLLSILFNILFIFFHKNRNAINHITGDIHYGVIGLIGCKSVLTIHDTGGLDFNNYNAFKRFIFKQLWFKIPLKLATCVVCISNETKKNVLRYTNRKDIRVVHNAIDPMFTFHRKNINFANPRILIIGTNLNKNLFRTFDALFGFPCTLVIIGKLNQEHLKSLKKNKIQYENKSDLTDNEIFEEYLKCDIVSFVSLYEGFGMPVIEANAVGRPIICSDIPVLREIARNSALFVNPYDVASIKKAFLKLKKDRTLCIDLVENGKNNVNRFKKENIQKQWKDIYQKL